MNLDFLGTTLAALESPAKMLLLLVIANGMPVLGKKIFGATFDRPLDGGMRLRDGHPLFKGYIEAALAQRQECAEQHGE